MNVIICFFIALFKFNSLKLLSVYLKAHIKVQIHTVNIFPLFSNLFLTSKRMNLLKNRKSNTNLYQLNNLCFLLFQMINIGYK